MSMGVSNNRSNRESSRVIDYVLLGEHIENIVARQLAGLSFRQVSPETSQQGLHSHNNSQQFNKSSYRRGINPEKVTQLTHSWNLKFKRVSIEEFLYRVETLIKNLNLK